MLKPPRRARASALPPAEYHRPRPKPVRKARPPAPPADLQLTDEQIELLRALGGERTGSRQVPDAAWSTARALQAVGLLELDPPPPRLSDMRPVWRPAPVDTRPWRATITEHGRRVLERTGGST